MKVPTRYSKILFLALSFLFLTQGCSFYAGFHTKSTPQSGTKMTQSVTPNEGGTSPTASNQGLGNTVR